MKSFVSFNKYFVFVVLTLIFRLLYFISINSIQQNFFTGNTFPSTFLLYSRIILFLHYLLNLSLPPHLVELLIRAQSGKVCRSKYLKPQVLVMKCRITMQKMVKGIPAVTWGNGELEWFGFEGGWVVLG